MYALVDCNNLCLMRTCFSAEFNEPVAILSNNDGCVISRSNEEGGRIGMGAPAFQIKEIVKQHDVQLFSSNYALYGDLSNQ
jgi:DNA polymerase V